MTSTLSSPAATWSASRPISARPGPLPPAPTFEQMNLDLLQFERDRPDAD